VAKFCLIGCNRVQDQTNKALELQSNDNLDPASLSREVAFHSTSRAGPPNLIPQLNGHGDAASALKGSVSVLGVPEPSRGIYQRHSAASANPMAAKEVNQRAATSDQKVTSVILAPIIGDSKSINPEKWDLLSATERVAFLQRWLMYVEVKYKGPVGDWPKAFAKEWYIVKNRPSAAQCLISASQKVTAGRSLLNYIAHVMEGDLPDNAQQWRALYIQAYHINGSVNCACASLQCKIDAALDEIA
jgi:hypothetical protein